MVKVADHSAVIYGTHFPNRIFVGCLPSKATAQDLADFFSNFGCINEAKIVLDENGNSKRFGFVSFGDENGVNVVLNQGSIFFLGKKINVGPAVKKKFADDTKGKPATLIFSDESLKTGGKSRVTYRQVNYQSKLQPRTTPPATTHPILPKQCCTMPYMCQPFVPTCSPMGHSTIFPVSPKPRQFDQFCNNNNEINPFAYQNSQPFPYACITSSPLLFSGPLSYSGCQSRTTV
eukprot:gene7361-8181_t